MSDDLLAIADRIIAQARPGEEVEVVVSRGSATDIRVYDGQVEHLASATSAGIGVRILTGQREGFASAGSLDDDVVADTLADARDNAAFVSEDEWLGLAVPDGVAVPDLDLYRAGAEALSTEAKIELAMDLERSVRGADGRITGIDASDYYDGISDSVVVSTAGVRTVDRSSSCNVSVSCVAEDDGDTQTGFGFSVGRAPDELDLDRAAADAAQRATRLLGAVQPESGRVTVVLDPYVTAQFLSIIGSTLSGSAVQKGRSLFADRLGDEVAASGFTLIDDATNPWAWTASQTDREGLASRRNVLIDSGRLGQFVHNAYSARRAGTTSTANAVGGIGGPPGVACRALSLTPGTQTQAELLSTVDAGVLISSVKGLHSGVNAVSGDFSTGAEGLRIVDGQLGQPLREFTIASTLQRMLLDVIGIGGDLEWLPSRSAGLSLVVRDVTVSGR